MRPAPRPPPSSSPLPTTPPFLHFLFVYRILFLRQQSKELDKLKNQNSYMV